MEATIQTIMEAALQQGIWAALYIYLFFRMLKENAAREEKYQAMIDSLSTMRRKISRTNMHAPLRWTR